MIKTQDHIEKIFEKKIKDHHYQITKIEKSYINKTISKLNSGTIRIAEKINGTWITHQWIKKCVLLYLYSKSNKIIKTSNNVFYDKIPLKYKNYNESNFIEDSVRTVPNSIVRFGAFIGKNVVLMPSFVNIGAYIGKNTMIDAWATIGSCAQIGCNVHISGGVGIGGVLEPLQNNPTIIEDNCFIGARSEIVEGVIVEKNSVISMGVYISQSTKIYDRETGKILYGRVPSGSVVVSGTLPSKNHNNIHLYCAVIVKKVDNNTLKKTELNSLLRGITIN
ncbi:2,3,4,5-tetrahydropyridine-2,6-dicarboxylate N-succinyltransferase [Buchnera aphidicola (Cinara kochiana kochiana)]|uniref:2,3,4,5-tetrahydropyridine-2,6-dicarboxylate N-succinyltransferase n=1 Tax=Buchnera aphidicola (Cinara kochiana kochiana) TaxID=2518976 RepID=A0A451D5M5_9GAMM|nr:2,3,4,5-tetrahydropyridine-2,6-dicarboxylate N-succinyltransferase [Buchnera aphidicola]VFP81065.1 2,3,4,5-tetrahydropyridine-2,6-dicarboxylate N-succinyltransferase [Buchnera aphidicola (Cinara kochiana kochiana)]